MMLKRVLIAMLFTIATAYANPYPLYVHYIPYTPPNLHLQTTRVTTAYYLPSFLQGTTYNFTTPNLTTPVRFASGPVPMRLAVYRSPFGCSGTRTLQITLQFRIAGVFTTVASTTQTITIPNVGAIVPVFAINGLQLMQQYQLNAGDAIRLSITPTVGGKLCMVNEYPLNGTDLDATHIVLQTAPSLTINKVSFVVSDPVNGTVNPKRIPGARVRYTVVVTNSATASGSANNVVLNDPIPLNTSYSPGSIVIDGAPQTDAVDADMGAFVGNSVKANLGTMLPAASHTIRFDVTVN